MDGIRKLKNIIIFKVCRPFESSETGRRTDIHIR